MGAPETVPAGKVAREGGESVELGAELAFDVGDEVHDVAVALHVQLLGDAHGAGDGDAADVVAAEVEQHDVFSQLLFVGAEVGFDLAVLLQGCAAVSRSGDGMDGDLAVLDAHHPAPARCR